MTFTRDDLMARLDDLAIAARTVEHPPFRTVEEGRAFKAAMPGGHSKNLFVRDKKKRYFLIAAHCDTVVDLVHVGKAMGARGRLSFGSAEAMGALLGVEPGSVTPFALGTPAARGLAGFVVDAAFMDFDTVWFHPLKNTASTAIAPTDLMAFARACGHEPKIMALSAPPPSARETGA